MSGRFFGAISDVVTPRYLANKGWPASVPVLFVPADEGHGSWLRNYGNMGRNALKLANALTQWRSDGWFTSEYGATRELAWDASSPEEPTLLDKLFFFRACTAASPGIGGNIALMSFRLEAGKTDSPVPGSRVFLAGVSGANANSVAWGIFSNLSRGELNFFRRDGFSEVTSTYFVRLGEYLDDNEIGTEVVGGVVHIVILLDALNKDLYVWKDGVPVTLTTTIKNSVTALFKKFTTTTQWDTNAITVTLGNTNVSNFTPGTRTGDSVASGLVLLGKPLGDVFYADVTALDSVLAARRDAIALAMFNSPRGTLSSDVVSLITP